MINFEHPLWVASGYFGGLLTAATIWLIKHNRNDGKVINTDPPLAVPDVIVTISKYLDDTTKLQATNAYGVPVVETGKNHVIDTVLKDAGYQHIQQYSIEPPQATLEASTTPEPVAVTVDAPRTVIDEGLDDVYIEKSTKKPSQFKELKAKLASQNLIDA